jgi:2-polyprenyl-3-methyl-5-hydroxy-6-metoxy-1,4-benzoquinol methylase
MIVNNYDSSKVYDEIYKNEDNYNPHVPEKDEYIDKFVESIEGRILDAGCGQGNHLKRLRNNGFDVFGIEISKFVCDSYLQDVPHMNSDIISFAKCNHDNFEAVICLDVLEHIPEGEIDVVLSSLCKLSDSFLFGIANHSDIKQGYELHLIQEDSNWWATKLAEHFKNVELTKQLSQRFFFFTCGN